jgi:hypothetical protein
MSAPALRYLRGLLFKSVLHRGSVSRMRANYETLYSNVIPSIARRPEPHRGCVLRWPLSLLAPREDVRSQSERRHWLHDLGRFPGSDSLAWTDYAAGSLGMSKVVSILCNRNHLSVDRIWESETSFCSNVSFTRFSIHQPLTDNLMNLNWQRGADTRCPPLKHV